MLLLLVVLVPVSTGEYWSLPSPRWTVIYTQHSLLIAALSTTSTSVPVLCTSTPYWCPHTNTRWYIAVHSVRQCRRFQRRSRWNLSFVKAEEHSSVFERSSVGQSQRSFHKGACQSIAYVTNHRDPSRGEASRSNFSWSVVLHASKPRRVCCRRGLSSCRRVFLVSKVNIIRVFHIHTDVNHRNGH